MSRLLVGLVINYRDAQRTANCVHALLGNGVEHVIVWDNSEDGGASACDLRSLFADGRRIDIEVSARNLGFASGVNRGLEVCRRHNSKARVLLINNDAIAPSGLVDSLAQALEETEGAVLAFPALRHAGRRIDEVYYHRWLGLLTYRRWPGAFRLPRGCCLMLATDRWTGALFDEDFFMYGEEIELGWRLRKQVAALVHVSEMLVVHEGSASSGMNSLFYEARMVAAHLILARKLGVNRLETLLLYFLRIPMLLARAVLRSIRYRSLTPFTALWHGARLVFLKSAKLEPSSSDRFGA